MKQWLQRLANAALLVGGGAFLCTWMQYGDQESLLVGVFLIIVGTLLIPGSEPAPNRLLLLGLRKRQERALLQLARRSGGRLTTPEVALEFSLSLSEAKGLLDAMVLSGYAGYSIEDGQLVYRLPIAPEATKPSLLEKGRTLKEQHPSHREIEQKLVQLALRRAGQLSAPEVTAELGLSLDEAKEWLDSLVARGHVGCEVTDDGRLVYRLLESDDPERLAGLPEAEETVVTVAARPEP